MNRKIFNQIIIVGITTLVVAIGIFHYFATRKPTAIVSQTDWTTYQNDQYGFEINLPPNWKVEQDAVTKSIYFYSPESQQALEAIRKALDSGQTVGDAGVSPDFAFGFNMEQSSNATSSRQVIYNGTLFNTFSIVGYAETEYLYFETTKNNQTYSFWSGEGAGKAYLPQILSTFKFLEPARLSNWKPYENDQLGFTARYPSSWSVEIQNGLVIFSLPNDIVSTPSEKTSGSITIPVAVWISKDTTKFYNNLNEYETAQVQLNAGNAGSMNFSVVGYEQIDGKDFFKDSWTHMAQGLNYVTLRDGHPFDIQFRMDDAVIPFYQSASYQDFLTFLSTIRFTQ